MHSFVIAAAKLHNIATGQWILESESVTIIVTFTSNTKIQANKSCYEKNSIQR